MPFAIANTLAVATWSRTPRPWRTALVVAVGALWIVTVVPYHVLPLLNGIVTWQNVSGLSRIAAGVIMIAGGLTLAFRRPMAR